MARGLALSAGVTAFIALVLLHETCSATAKAHPCAPSSCGDIHDVSSPFQLKTDPKNCGDPRYELLCENNHTVVYLAEGRKYYVQEINYSMYRIRVVEPVIQKENYIDISTPSNSLYRLLQYYYRSGSQETDLSLELHRYGIDNYNWIMVFMSCEKPVNTPLYLNTSTCIYKGEYSSNSSISDSKRYKYGFQLSWLKFLCERKCGRGRTCSIYDLQCAGKSGLSRLVENIYNKLLGWWQPEYIFKGISSPPFYIPDYYGYNDWYYLLMYFIFIHAAKMSLGAPCVVAFLIYKWRKRHLSMYDGVEEFLQSQNNLMPVWLCI